jgi:uncharacterized membrane protein YeaQ/YmgE (transglycosylase-associated protein family)
MMQGNADYFILNIMAGVVGSILGLAIYFFVSGNLDNLGLFSWRGTVCSLIGAIIAVTLFDGLHRLAPKRAAHIDTDADQGNTEEKLEED